MSTILTSLGGRDKKARGPFVELMVITAIALVLVSAVMNVSVGGSKDRRVDEEIQLAWSACRNVIEEIRTIPDSQILALNGQGFDVPGPSGESEGLDLVKGNLSGMSGIITSEIAAKAASMTLYRVIVTVNWTGVSGEQDLSLQTLIAKR